jgi:hypothetical protein
MSSRVTCSFIGHEVYVERTALSRGYSNSGVEVSCAFLMSRRYQLYWSSARINLIKIRRFALKAEMTFPLSVAGKHVPCQYETFPNPLFFSIEKGHTELSTATRCFLELKFKAGVGVAFRHSKPKSVSDRLSVFR